MNCKNCLHQKLCKHYNYFATNFLDIIEINCDDYQEKLKKMEAIHVGQANLGTIRTTARPQRFNQFDAEFETYEKLYPDFFKEEDTSKNILKAEPVEIQSVQCERCKQMVPSTEIENCDICGRPVCQNCQVNFLEDSNIKTQCESCWSNTPDPELDENGEPVVVFGKEEKDPWDIETFESKEKTTAKEKEVKEEKEDDEPKKKNNRKSVKKFENK